MPRWSRQRNRWRSTLGAYDSKFEKDLHEKELAECEFHPKDKISYTVSHKYSPDFIVNKGKRKLIIESKGRFGDTAEAMKYVHVRENLPKGHELVFLFQTPHLPFPGARMKKDGTKTTHAQWAEKRGFRWFDRTSICEVLDEFR
jgi:hypothetical protein